MPELNPLLTLAESAGDMKAVAYGLFLLLVIGFLVLDLGVFHREAHEVRMKEAVTWSVVWLTLGLAFSVFVYFAYERHWLGLGLNTRIFNLAAAPDASQPLIVYGEVSGATAASSQAWYEPPGLVWKV